MGGFTFTNDAFGSVTGQPLLVTMSVTVKLPVSIYWCVGFCIVDVPPSPKLHCQVSPSLVMPLNWMMPYAHTGLGDAVKSVTGTLPTTTASGRLNDSVQPVLVVTVKDTV